MEIKVLLFIFSCYFFCGEGEEYNFDFENFEKTIIIVLIYLMSSYPYISAESLMCYKCSSTNHTCNDGACNSTTGYCETVTEYLSDGKYFSYQNYSMNTEILIE